MAKVILSATLAVNAFCYLRTGNLCFASIEKTSREYPVSDESKTQKKKDVSMTGRRKAAGVRREHDGAKNSGWY